MKYDIYVTKDSLYYNKDKDVAIILFIDSRYHPSYFCEVNKEYFNLGHPPSIRYSDTQILSDKGVLSNNIIIKSIEGMYKL